MNATWPRLAPLYAERIASLFNAIAVGNMMIDAAIDAPVFDNAGAERWQAYRTEAEEALYNEFGIVVVGSVRYQHAKVAA